VVAESAGCVGCSRSRDGERSPVGRYGEPKLAPGVAVDDGEAGDDLGEVEVAAAEFVEVEQEVLGRGVGEEQSERVPVEEQVEAVFSWDIEALRERTGRWLNERH